MLKKITIALVSIFFLLASVLVGAYFFRKPLAHWAITAYASRQQLKVKLDIKTLDWNEVLIENISIEDGVHIPKVHVLRDSNTQQLGNIRALTVEVASIDILTTQKLIEQFSGTESSATASEKLLFADISTYCEQLFPTEIQIQLKNLIHENTTVPLNLELSHKAQTTESHFSFSGKKLDFTKNEKFVLKTEDYSGSLTLSCTKEGIVLSGDPIFVDIAELSLKNPSLKMNNSRVVSQKVRLHIGNDNKATLHFPLNLKISAQTDTQTIKGQLPDFLVSATYFLDASQKSTLEMSAKNVEFSNPQKASVQKVLLSLSTPSDWVTLLEGTLHLNNITYTPPPAAPKKGASQKAQKNVSPKPLFNKVSSKIRFQKLGEVIKALVDVSDATKNLAIRGLKIEHSSKATTAEFLKTNTQIKLNSQITELLPLTKEHIKTISGTLSANGRVQFKNDELSGKVKLFGKDIDVSSGYGDVTGLNWEHDVVSFKTFASSPHQTLRLKSFTAGKTIENIALDYQVISLDVLNAEKLHLEYDKALIDAENFTIHPLKQELIGFKATIKNLPLESVLTMALGPFVSATGLLNGHVNLEFEDKIPTMNGRLTSEKDGWILYRKQGDSQQKGLQFSDSPMSILNSYLYNFNYKTLDLDLRSNKKYQMNVLLGAYGHNPDYLKGKPLKLKINLEQNVLAAIQSMMLSYDLPSKLKERIEDNTEE